MHKCTHECAERMHLLHVVAKGCGQHKMEQDGRKQHFTMRCPETVKEFDWFTKRVEEFDWFIFPGFCFVFWLCFFVLPAGPCHRSLVFLFFFFWFLLLAGSQGALTPIDKASVTALLA